jgi:hypothetical protein
LLAEVNHPIKGRPESRSDQSSNLLITLDLASEQRLNDQNLRITDAFNSTNAAAENMQKSMVAIQLPSILLMLELCKSG